MAKKITGNRDGKNSSNKTYSIPGRSTSIPRTTIVKEVKRGQHPNHTTYKLNGKEFIRAKPDNSKKNNVNK